MSLTKLCVISLLALCLAWSSSAGIVFYTSQVAFNAAVASLTLAGTEDFEGSNLPPNTMQSFNDPLAPGVANGPFPLGTTTAAGVSVQSNTLGATPITTSPRGVSGLVTASIGVLDTPSDQVSNNIEADSTDLTFAPSNGQYVRAVGMAPLYFDTNATSSTSHPGTLVIQVYGADKTTLLGTQSIGSVVFSGSSFLGVVADGGDVIGRINIWDGSDTLHWQGADNVSVWTTATLPVGLVTFTVR